MNAIDSRPLFIFEMANNHMGDVDHGLRILREVHEHIQDFQTRFQLAMKLQYRNLDSFIHPAWRDRRDLKYVKRFQETRLSEYEFRVLREEMDRLGLLSVCTPFDESSVDLIEAHHFSVIKVASCSITDWPLLERIARCDKPIVASVAGAPLEDIDKVVSFFQHRRKNFSLMHCVAEYPTSPHHLELNQIDLLHARYPGIRIGYSTHEDPKRCSSVGLAIAKGASIFEKHVGVPTESITLNDYSSTPQQARAWLEDADEAVRICGVEGRRLNFAQAELDSLHSLRRGVFAVRDIFKGERIHSADIFLAIPTQPGQLTANDLSKYTTFDAQECIQSGSPVLSTAVIRIDHREKAYNIVQRVNSMILKSGVVVPGQAELEISHHLGIDRFEEIGATLINLVNREYCKKLIVLLPGQSHPEHCHNVKEETFLVVYGDISINLNGIAKECKPGDLLVVERGTKHSFCSKNGAIMEEISSTHHKNDSYYTDPSIPRGEDRKTLISYWLGCDSVRSKSAVVG